MARRTDLISLAIRMARASAADQRRQNNAYIRQQNALHKQAEREQKLEERNRLIYYKEKAIQFAADRTDEDEKIRMELQSLLVNSIERPLNYQWNDYKRKDVFTIERPEPRELKSMPIEIGQNEFIPTKKLIDRILKKRYAKKVAEGKEKRAEAVRTRNVEITKITEFNESIIKDNDSMENAWLAKKEEFEIQKKEHNANIDAIMEKFYISDNEAVEFYFDNLLNYIKLPEYFDIQWEVEYNQESKILIIDLDLPKKENIPSLKVMKYVQTRKEYVETYLKDKEIDSRYDNIILQLVLRICHDIYISDVSNKT